MHYYDIETIIPLRDTESLLTYASNQQLEKGTVVLIPFGRKRVLGIVVRKTKKPGFTTKEIERTIATNHLPHSFSDFAKWFLRYYAVKNDEASTTFLPNFLMNVPKKAGESKIADPKTQPLQELTPQQADAVKKIEKSTSPIILHGIVGSGKTRVYLELAQKMLINNRSSLILCPEIPISTHLAHKTTAIFGKDRVVLYHSNLTANQRRQIWIDILSNKEPKIVIGPRSALFLPFDKLGLICVDEFHESSYKQQDKSRYSSNDVASALAKIHHARLVFGSATPPLREYEIAKQKEYPIITLDTLAINGLSSERTYKIIDQRERSSFTTDPYLSNELIQSIREALINEQQILLLHNRRGTARAIICEDCGWTMDCPSCDSHLVYHQDRNQTLCHICGFRDSLPVACPECGKLNILLKSIGTKALAHHVEKLFPSAKVARFDSDNFKHESLGARMVDVENGKIDVLVGTQLLAKGLDLKKLQVVGIISADSSLQLPDFSSSERFYQMIVQAAGRVGRGHGKGVCIIQTLQPNNPLFKAIIEQDWEKYYLQEISQRKLHRYPPFCFMAKFWCARKTIKGAENAGKKFVEGLRQRSSSMTVLGPTPAFRERERGSYMQTVIVKCNDRKILLDIARTMPSGWYSDIDPISLI